MRALSRFVVRDAGIRGARSLREMRLEFFDSRHVRNASFVSLSLVSG